MAKQHFIFTVIFSLAVFVPPLHAFSLGPIDVKNGFGERFSAEIVVSVDGEGNAEFHIGTQEDYAKLGLKRFDVIDELEVVPLLENKGKNKILRVISNRPLFYPSFNLLIRAEKNGGTILENYFIAVDFQQNLSLATKGEKASVGKSEEKDEVKTENKSVKEPAKKSVKEKSPAATLALPSENTKKDKPLAQPGSPGAKAPPAPQSPPVRKSYGPVARGDSLWRIAGKLGYGEAEAMRVAVAIWTGNRDKFVGGNIHGVKINESLDLGNLDTILAQVSLSTAKETIRAQLQEWKQRGSAEKKNPAESGNSKSPATASDSPEILLLLEGWRQSWEAGDLDRHMAYFSNRSQSSERTPYANWKEVKKRMFDRHTNVKIRVERIIVKKNGQWVVTFDQSFHSDQMDTFGRKSLDLIREENDWKIVNETFVRGKREVKDRETLPATESAPANAKVEILRALEDWRQSWEAGDLDRHMELFSKQPTLIEPDGEKIPFKVWENIKKRMFDRYKNVEVRLGVPVFKQSGDRWTLSMDQTFHSDKMKTFGRKKLEFVREGSGWKIVKEEFVPVNPPDISR